MFDYHLVATPPNLGKLLVEQEGEDDHNFEVTIPYSNAVGFLV